MGIQDGKGNQSDRNTISSLGIFQCFCRVLFQDPQLLCDLWDFFWWKDCLPAILIRGFEETGLLTFPVQYPRKSTAFVTTFFVWPAVFATCNDRIMTKAALYGPVRR